MCNIVEGEALFNYLIGLTAIFPIAAVVLVWELKHVIISTIITLGAYFSLYFLLPKNYDFQFFLDKGGVLFVSMVLVSTIIQITRYSNLKKLEKTKMLLEVAVAKERQAEIKMNVLGKQINPHYIFNALASIQNFVQSNKSEKALEFINKYSVLLRNSLHDEKNDLITLEQELEVLKSYLELEVLRSNYQFKFSINVKLQEGQEEVLIPPFIFQPYIENSVWHGVRHLSNKCGLISIDVKETPDHGLLVVIKDNGVGRAASKIINQKRKNHKSVGISNTEERMLLFKKLYDVNFKVETKDIVSEGIPEGTEVLMVIDF